MKLSPILKYLLIFLLLTLSFTGFLFGLRYQKIINLFPVLKIPNPTQTIYQTTNISPSPIEITATIIPTGISPACGRCPQYSPASADFCKNGKILPGVIDNCSCQGPPRCQL
ncbi:MAG: hypothetical protein Q7K55_02240 [Candidatus Levybacteria bacterium]|nr:hypothetical protein [Candidatus Levybacteria bacterium]